MPWVPVTEDEYLDSRNEDFNAKKKEVEIALLEYLFYFDENPAIILEEETLLESVIWNGEVNGNGKLAEAAAEEKCMLPKIQMHSEADDIEAHRAIIKLGKMLAHLRAVVPTYSTPRVQGGGTDYTYGMPMVEDPGRAITVMRSLAKGHALSHELKVAGLVDLTGSEEEEKIHGITMGVVLKNEFEWFLSEDFAKIRKALLKEKYPPCARQKRE
jgi:hypothetical protein